MARYIDVDALIAEIESNSRKTWSEDINTVFWGNAVKIKDNIKRCIERQPTADVVPRAEVAPRCAFAYDGETLEHCVQAPCPNFKTVEEIRAEVAREIFARLEEAIDYAIQSATKTLSKERDVLYSGFLGGKNEAYKYTLCFLNQLKKEFGVKDDDERTDD